MTDSTNSMVMPVAPYYGGGNGGGFGFGDQSGWWLILLLICLGGGWGFGGGFGGGNGMGPMMVNNDVQRGFDQSAVISGINGVHDAVTSGFAGVQQSLCSGFAGVQNGFAQADIANNARQIADMQQNFAMQTALQQCCCDNKAGLADVKYTIATEGCNTRATSTANTQAILDKLCQLELDGVKGQLADANNTINQLRTQLLVANNEASQTAQTAAILAGQGAEVDALYNRLNTCPVPSMPVYGRTPIFTCNGNNYGGCGCGAVA